MKSNYLIVMAQKQTAKRNYTKSANTTLFQLIESKEKSQIIGGKIKMQNQLQQLQKTRRSNNINFIKFIILINYI